ncbi:MAG TPA: dihydrofolate reductase [Candidatus Saccharimonadales bacterium]|nr:dihydrofolate reductase [Candidatus Saccharimonadales bacterium]
MILLIAAIDSRRGLAKDGKLPWKIPEDERYFTQQTKTRGGHVLTGATTFRATYHGKPLVRRHNYILTHKKDPIPGATVVQDLPGLLDKFAGLGRDLWVAGGADVFKQIIDMGKADELYLTHIEGDFGCDQFFPEYGHTFRLAEESDVREQNGHRFTYARYVRE